MIIAAEKDAQKVQMEKYSKATGNESSSVGWLPPPVTGGGQNQQFP